MFSSLITLNSTPRCTQDSADSYYSSKSSSTPSSTSTITKKARENGHPQLRVAQTKTEIVKLNVGGKKFATTLCTLQNQGQNLLTLMLDNKAKGLPSLEDDEGYLFIDRNGTVFEVLLDYLRTGTITLPSNVSAQQVLNEADFFLIAVPSNKLSKPIITEVGELLDGTLWNQHVQTFLELYWKGIEEQIVKNIAWGFTQITLIISEMKNEPESTANVPQKIRELQFKFPAEWMNGMVWSLLMHEIESKGYVVQEDAWAGELNDSRYFVLKWGYSFAKGN